MLLRNILPVSNRGLQSSPSWPKPLNRLSLNARENYLI